MAFKYTLKEDGKTMLVNDPIYGEIEVKQPFSQIILTKEMQRLEDITQTGFSEYDYPGLKNNERLSHSVGAFYIMSQIIEHIEGELKRYDISISKDEKDIALCSMLLHDIGHGPFSHTFERIANYSHEKRTTDILLGNTEVNHLLTEIYGTKKVKRIASYIAEINDEDIEKNESSFTKLLHSLISHQIDADRLDYLVRDSYYAGLPTAIRYKDLISALEISVNSNQEYELLINKKGLTTIETVLIERFQRYRDVYYTKADGVIEKVFLNILKRYKENPNVVKKPIPDQFIVCANNSQKIDLDKFLTMTNTPFMEAINIIKNNTESSVLKYLCDFPKVLNDYENLENKVSPDIIKEKLSKIFDGRNFDDTMALLSVKSRTKLYKKEESLRINYGNLYKDLSEATPHLIRTDEYVERNELFFNQELLRIELGLSVDKFNKYREDIKNMINDLNKKPEEFELKYIMDKNKKIGEDIILQTLLENGFKSIKEKKKENDDEYYDTRDLSLIKKGGSLRIRKLTTDGKHKYKATYKMPTTKGEVYSSREEIEIELEQNSLDELKEKMKNQALEVDLSKIFPKPLLNSITQRRDIVLLKNGVQVCLSFDNTNYRNHIIKGANAEDSMVEIEALGNVGDRVMLNEINNIFKEKFPGLETNKQSKYERGIIKTVSNKRLKGKMEREL